MSRQTLHSKLQDWAGQGVTVAFGPSPSKGAIKVVATVDDTSEEDTHLPITYLKETPLCLTIDAIVQRVKAKVKQ